MAEQPLPAYERLSTMELISLIANGIKYIYMR